MKIYWGRGILALLAVIAGILLGYVFDLDQQHEDEIPASLEARYRFNQKLIALRQRLEDMLPK